jgi:2-dehydropantoate 2-reductase
MPIPFENPSQLVFGTGLTGGFLLGALMHSGANVSALARPSNESCWNNGLELSDYHDNHASLAKPTRVASNDTQAFDLIWLTIKCTATATIIDDLRPFVGPNTCIVCCQNGFGSDAVIRAAFPNNVVDNAIVGFNVARVSPAHLRRATEGNFVISKTLADTFALDFGSALMPLHVSDNMLAYRWAKLQINLANAVNALADVPVKTMLEDRAYRRVIAAIMRELLTVVKLKGIQLPKVVAIPGRWMPTLMTLPNPIYLAITQSSLAIDPSARASMWWDLNNKVKTEIEFINGAVSQAGQELGMPTPANDALISLVKEVECGARKRDWSAQQFHDLLLKPADSISKSVQ